MKTPEIGKFYRMHGFILWAKFNIAPKDLFFLIEWKQYPDHFEAIFLVNNGSFKHRCRGLEEFYDNFKEVNIENVP